jgi:hypothetical protein
MGTQWRVKIASSAHRRSGSVMLIDSSVDAICIVAVRIPIHKIRFIRILCSTVAVLHNCTALCEQYSQSPGRNALRRMDEVKFLCCLI